MKQVPLPAPPLPQGRSLSEGLRAPELRFRVDELGTEVVIAPRSLVQVGPRLRSALPHAAAAAVLADANVRDPADRVVGALEAAGFRVTRLDLPAGERAKTLEAVKDVWHGLLDADIGRSDVVIAVGGGALLDAAGFAAATFRRGIALVNVPTTVLAMADAALGGKVAVDLAGAKNQVGAFHPATLVIVDPETLASLPSEEIRAGLAEVLKAAVLGSPEALAVLEEGDPWGGSALAWLIEEALRVKAGYVAADPHDHGARQALNLGHTFGHALESASGFSLRHGEAVAVGLVAAARLGQDLGLTPPDLTDRIVRSVEGLGLPLAPPPELDPARILEAIAADKKRRAGRAVFVVPTGAGAVLVEGLEPQRAVEALGVVVR
ncbi:MAG TPA: 3-dehydroquinate synthase family protein [Actinomycetota bacterium]|nr:3-dehydroquinate synthase family protein [Actinomycetota bacterium]